MKKMVRNCGFILSMICIVASPALAVTGPQLLAKNDEEAGLKELLPQAVQFTAVKSQDKVLYYKALDANGKCIGAAFKAHGKGYSSTIETMAGMLKDGTITAIKIISPGLDASVLNLKFTSQFSNKDISRLNEVQAVTGATISSRAVIDSVQKKAEEIKALIKNER